MKKFKNLFVLATAVLLMTACGNTTTAQTSNSLTTSEESGTTASDNSGSAVIVDSGTSVNVDTSLPEVISVDSSTEIKSVTLEGYESASTITLADGASISSDTSVTIDNANNIVTITAAGTYVLSGTLSNGAVQLKAKSGDVVIVLNGISITSSDTVTDMLAPISSNKKFSSLKVVVPEGSLNYVCDNRSNANVDNDDLDLDKGALTFKVPTAVSGSGTLKIIGNGKAGLQCSKNMTVDEVNLEITAIDNALKANLGLTFGATLAPTITINSTLDAIVNDGDEDSLIDSATQVETPIEFDSGTYNIVALDDGISKDLFTDIIIKGGVFNITTGGGYKSTNAGSATSSKGIKCKRNILISGGEFAINSKDDAIHASDQATYAPDETSTTTYATNTKGVIELSGGTFVIYAGDDGVHADYSTTIKDKANVNVVASYEGVEGALVTFDGGYTNIVSSDDGVNAANGDYGDSSNAFDFQLDIKSGYLFVNAGGDGVDSNGDLTVSGGFTVVAGPTDNGNGQLDFGDLSGDKLTVNGGTLIAYGSGSMMNFSTSNLVTNQNTFFLGQTSASANQYYVVTDSSKNIIAAIKAIKNSASLFMTCDEFGAGSYTVYVASSINGSTELFGNVYSATGYTSSSSTAVTFANATGSYYGVANSGGQGGNPGGGNPGGGGRP